MRVVGHAGPRDLVDGAHVTPDAGVGERAVGVGNSGVWFGGDAGAGLEEHGIVRWSDEIGDDTWRRAQCGVVEEWVEQSGGPGEYADTVLA